MAVQMRRLYVFEVCTALNFVTLFFAYPAIAPMMADTLPSVFVPFVIFFVVQALIGMGIRLALAKRRGTVDELLAVYRSGSWIVDTLRIGIFSGLWVHAYSWIKLTAPILNPHLFDQQLWNLDRTIAFGYSPNLFLLTLFSSPALLRVIDLTYASVLVPGFSIVPAFFASAPEHRVRIAFMNSNTLLWTAGAWLYVAVPALGPAYRFPEVWLPFAPLLTYTQVLQRLLMTNYHAVQISARAGPQPINVFFGVAAFPSLHVGFQVLSFLWMQRLTRWGGTVFGILALFTFIGSIVTGWHYAIDGIAGALLAVACYAASQRISARRASAIQA
ncbi:MAG TPA: phosphatase PAP2 family protein [Thermoanaerobaculia bacterium]|nr:phosphatase PAP2 family protein [Thermoanaerobaculia bacterium]